MPSTIKWWPTEFCPHGFCEGMSTFPAGNFTVHSPYQQVASTRPTLSYLRDYFVSVVPTPCQHVTFIVPTWGMQVASMWPSHFIFYKCQLLQCPHCASTAPSCTIMCINSAHSGPALRPHLYASCLYCTRTARTVPTCHLHVLFIDLFCPQRAGTLPVNRLHLYISCLYCLRTGRAMPACHLHVFLLIYSAYSAIL